jgi:hypothetical protein
VPSISIDPEKLAAVTTSKTLVVISSMRRHNCRDAFPRAQRTHDG